MKRRKFIAVIGGGAATWPLLVRAQSQVPVIGYLNAGSSEANAHLMTAFRQALAAVGYVEKQNVKIEYR